MLHILDLSESESLCAYLDPRISVSTRLLIRLRPRLSDRSRFEQLGISIAQEIVKCNNLKEEFYIVMDKRGERFYNVENANCGQGPAHFLTPVWHGRSAALTILVGNSPKTTT